MYLEYRRYDENTVHPQQEHRSTFDERHGETRERTGVDIMMTGDRTTLEESDVGGGGALAH